MRTVSRLNKQWFDVPLTQRIALLGALHVRECFLLVLCLGFFFFISLFVRWWCFLFFFITEDLIDPEILVFVFLGNFFIFVKEWTGVLSVDYPLLVALNVLL